MIDTRRLSKATIKMRFNSFALRLSEQLKKFKNSFRNTTENNEN